MAAKTEEKPLGRVTHYYSHLGVSIIELTGGELNVGVLFTLRENTPTSPRRSILSRSNTKTLATRRKVKV